VRDLGWGLLTQVVLPGGGKLGVYQPRHARPPAVRGTAAVTKKRAARKKTATKGQTAGKRRAAPRGAKTTARRR
jgi:hypothetical protein